ncbi:ribose 5-phosphate isomerase B [Larkinella insperata]|uniref:Ribose 5-phosphate isomerase B n=1 Tax=Larkinella insperata TaxID=332158 RepID=A0ABW3QJU5_9BACT|nr:ribose 5-phosphate isomerase B [Larkinella insperata]
MKPSVAVGADHAGFAYKQEIVAWLEKEGYLTKDFGTYSETSADYPDFAHPVAMAVEAKQFDWGVLVCGSGNGVAITANKHQGIRAALCWLPELAELARQHNNANVLCLPERYISAEEALECVKRFLTTDFEGGRHEKRVGKISC